MIPKFREPVKPGEILLKEFLIPMGISQVALAEKMNVPVQRINTLINGRRDMTAETAVLLSYALGTSTQFWMNLQTACDIYKAQKSLNTLKGIKSAVKRPLKKFNTVKS
ncbi:MAG: HigA family addiction module antidote protein [Ignavibacteria bacterium]|nr:HigA family addiction module antidote protein [Ignavibacteria bacterium]